MRRFVGYQGIAEAGQSLQKAAAVRTATGQESDEQETRSRKGGSHDCGYDRTRSRQHFNRHARLAYRSDQLESWIRHRRGTGVGDQCNIAGGQRPDDTVQPDELIVLVIALQRDVD
jgi:hypothetical protein